MTITIGSPRTLSHLRVDRYCRLSDAGETYAAERRALWDQMTTREQHEAFCRIQWDQNRREDAKRASRANALDVWAAITLAAVLLGFLAITILSLLNQSALS